MVLTFWCKFVYAVDISKPSLQKATDLFVKLDITEKTKVISGDGLEQLKADEVDDVIIAGLGSDTIEQIISKCGWLKNPDKRLILVPGSRHRQLREFIYLNGFEIIKERAVFEKGHSYTVMNAGYTGKSRTITPVFAELGRIPEFDGDKKEYINAVYLRVRNIIERAKTASSIAADKISDARQTVSYIEKLYEEYVG